MTTAGLAKVRYALKSATKRRKKKDAYYTKKEEEVQNMNEELRDDRIHVETIPGRGFCAAALGFN